jgi:hypothetical protein
MAPAATAPGILVAVVDILYNKLLSFRANRFTKNRIRAMEFPFFNKIHAASFYSYICLLLLYKLADASIPVEGKISGPCIANHHFSLPAFSDQLFCLSDCGAPCKCRI